MLLLALVAAAAVSMASGASAAGASSGLPCDVCSFVVGAAESYLRDNDGAAIGEVEKELNRICSNLGATLGPMCTSMVEQNVKAIVDELEHTPAGEVCGKLKLCDESADEVVKPEALPCTVCEFVVGYVEGYIKTYPNATLKAIEDAVNKNVCAHLGSFAPECNLLVDQELPAIIDALKNSPPDQVCREVHLCTSAAATGALELVAAKVEPAGLPFGCEACTFIVSELEDYVKANPDATEQEIIAEFETTCNALGPYADACKAWIKMEVPQILEYLTDMDPTQVCEKVGACSAGARLAAEALRLKKAAGGAECATCELVVHYLEALVANNDGAERAWLEGKLNRACSWLPSYNLECKFLVAKELDAMLKHISDGVPADEVCQKLHVCDAAATPALRLLSPADVVKAKVSADVRVAEWPALELVKAAKN